MTLLADADEYVHKHTGADGLPSQEEGAHLVLDLAAELRGRERELDELRAVAVELLGTFDPSGLLDHELDVLGRLGARLEDTTEETP